jgi:hypothetical protein
MTPSLTLGTLLDSFRLRRRWSGCSLKETMFVDKLMEAPKILVDGRNVLVLREVRAAGIRYRGFGQV